MLCVKLRRATPRPQMNRMSPTVTRVPPSTGSSVQNGNLEQIRNARMFGALRATKQCLKCHDAARGDLLGAFSYTLRAKSLP